MYGHEHDEGLSVITNEDSARYVNVDMGTVEGIQRAKDLGLLNHDIVDLIKTSYLYETAEMFKPVSASGAEPVIYCKNEIIVKDLNYPTPLPR